MTTPPYSTMVKLLILTGPPRAQFWKLQPEWIEGNFIKYPPEFMKQGKPIHMVEALLAHTSGTISGVVAIHIRHNFLEEAAKAVQIYEADIATILDDQ